MARLHARRKGKSHSNRPPLGRSINWLNISPEEVSSLAVKLKNDGVPTSSIGIELRDKYGVPGIKYVTGKSLVDVLKENNVQDAMPEDLMNLLTKAQRLNRHLQVHKTDRKNRHSLELVEAKVHRLSKYYKSKGILPADWRYKSVIAQLE
ncbi:MAG: 30S ribosomal protein S15 [Nitrososphaerota archaeon]|jgi:small subunit ribosomal protein S15|nr:30S ribosomal protein S15 [Nitrososphaerota archaeon]MDG6928137.1 30S ribosomal protein S15 [Nitrososphaerota archaeon]MDG6930976.1 30S ribosomal protein S15 [Nitrososphaerota archaeon]MDG6932800.1 30S ribosomal protein S15 [Nitrososphaerota archaeon]MDG6935317.1 30S ribosomal protein S15 [Nitrososphaerota archaeon]